MHNILSFRGSTLTMANDLVSNALRDRRLDGFCIVFLPYMLFVD